MKLIALFLTLLLSFNVFAQTGMEKNSTPKEEKYLYSPVNHMQTSVNLGVTYFNLGGDVDNDAKPGIKLGVHAEFGQGLTYMVGINYLMLKSETDLDSPLPGIKDPEFQLDYLSLALGAKYYIAGSNTGFYMRGNLNPSILINSSAKNSNFDDFEDFDILAGIGLGMTFSGATNFNIDVGYNMGLMDISKDDSESAKNQGVALTLGILF